MTVAKYESKMSIAKANFEQQKAMKFQKIKLKPNPP